MVSLNWKPFEAHKTQQELWNYRGQFAAVWAGRGSGKTDLAKRKLVISLPDIKSWPDPRYFYGAPTEQQAKRIAWDDFQGMIPPNWVRKINASDLYIETLWGARLYVVGLDKPPRVEGLQWDGGVIDESCDIKPGAFRLSILPALTWRKGWCWRIGVPKRQGIGAPEFKRLCQQAAKGLIDDTEAFNWASSDIVPRRLLCHARATMAPKDYKEQFDGQFQSAGGGVFYAFDEEVNIKPCSYQRNMPLIIGQDFNVDPIAWVIGHLWENRIEWIDELFIHDTNTAATLEILYQKYSHHRAGFRFFGDATGQARKTSAALSDYRQIEGHAGFKRLGRTVHYPKGNPPVEDRFAACNAMFKNRLGRSRMFVDPGCLNLIADLEARTYKKGTREPADVGDVGHITDAMGYPVHRLFPIQNKIEWATPVVVTTSGALHV